MTLTTVDWGCGDADVSEDVIVAECDRMDLGVRAAVLAVVTATGPGQFVSEWIATNTGEQMRLGDGLHRWVSAVACLRLLDPRPVKPPVMGWRQLT